MGVADDPGHAGKRGELFGSALGVAAGDDDAGGWILGVDFANGVACLRVGGGCDRASVYDDDVGGGGFGRDDTATVEQLAFESGAVGLRGAAAELSDVESGHQLRKVKNKSSPQSTQRAPSGNGSSNGVRLGPLRLAYDSRFGSLREAAGPAGQSERRTLRLYSLDVAPLQSFATWLANGIIPLR